MVKTRTETTESTTTLVQSQDGQYVYEFTHEFKKEGKSALILTLNAGEAVTTMSYDRTKYFIIGNLAGLGYRKMTMCTLFTRIGKQFKSSSYTDDEIKDSLGYLKKLLNKGGYDEIIVALGVAHEKDKKVLEAKKKLFELLIPCSREGRIRKIVDTMELYNQNEASIHPLFAGNYFGGRWKIVPYDIEKIYEGMISKEKKATVSKEVDTDKEMAVQ